MLPLRRAVSVEAGSIFAPAAFKLNRPALFTWDEDDAVPALMAMANSKPPPPPPEPKGVLKKELKYAPDAEPVAYPRPRTSRLSFSDAHNETYFHSPYAKDRLEEWFYTDEDFEEFERDASRPVQRKKKIGSGGSRRKKRSRSPPPSPAQHLPASAFETFSAPGGGHDDDNVDVDADGDPVLCRRSQGELADEDENFPECGNVSLQRDYDAVHSILPSAPKRQATSHVSGALRDSHAAHLVAPPLGGPPGLLPLQANSQLPPALQCAPPLWQMPAVVADPFAGRVSASAAAAAIAAHIRAGFGGAPRGDINGYGLPPRRATAGPLTTALPSLEPSPRAALLEAAAPVFTVGAPPPPASTSRAPPPTLRARRESRESAFSQLGVEELKQKIRQVATTRRQRLHGS